MPIGVGLFLVLDFPYLLWYNSIRGKPQEL